MVQNRFKIVVDDINLINDSNSICSQLPKAKQVNMIQIIKPNFTYNQHAYQKIYHNNTTYSSKNQNQPHHAKLNPFTLKPLASLTKILEQQTPFNS